MVRQICLDSDVLIDIALGKEEMINFIRQTEAEWFTTTINIFEIWSERKEKQKNIENLITGLKKTDLDEKSALKAGEIRKALKEKGEIIEIRDTFIGATCIENKLELLTNNKKHFERMKQFGLKLIE